MECKSTVRDSLQLKFGYLAKIAHEAANIGKMPAVTISFTLPDGSPFRNGDWVLIRMKDFEERFK